MKIVFEGKTLQECHEQVIAAANELLAIPGDVPVGTTKEAPRSAEGHVISGGKEWKPVEGRPGAYSGHPIETPQNVVKFPITPEHTAGVSTAGNLGQGQSASAGTVGEVDASGLPWDERIHSSSREKNNDGSWKKRRKVPDDVVAQVTAELRGATPAAPVPTPPGQVPPFGSMNPAQYQQVVQPQAPVQQAPPAMPTTMNAQSLPSEGSVLNTINPTAPAAFAPPQPMAALPPNTHNLESFRANLVNILTDLVNTGKINNQWINDSKGQFAGKEVFQWHENESGCKNLFEAFAQWGFINKL